MASKITHGHVPVVPKHFHKSNIKILKFPRHVLHKISHDSVPYSKIHKLPKNPNDLVVSIARFSSKFNNTSLNNHISQSRIWGHNHFINNCVKGGIPGVMAGMGGGPIGMGIGGVTGCIGNVIRRDIINLTTNLF